MTHTCQFRATNAPCGKRAGHLVRFPEGGQPDQWACSRHADRLWQFHGHYVPGKGGVVVEYVGRTAA